VAYAGQGALGPTGPGFSAVGGADASLDGAEGLGGGGARACLAGSCQCQRLGGPAYTDCPLRPPCRAARAFGEYLSQSHPENRNGAGRGL
jgi:hypothetical protein